MLSLRSSRGVTAALKPVIAGRAVKSVAPQASRTFSILTPLRPSLQPRALARAPTSVSSSAAIDTTTTSSASTGSNSEILDLLPKISTHPSLAGIQEEEAWVFVEGEDEEGEGDAAEEEEMKEQYTLNENVSYSVISLGLAVGYWCMDIGKQQSRKEQYNYQQAYFQLLLPLTSKLSEQTKHAALPQPPPTPHPIAHPITLPSKATTRVRPEITSPPRFPTWQMAPSSPVRPSLVWLRPSKAGSPKSNSLEASGDKYGMAAAYVYVRVMCISAVQGDGG
ncbi:hypothetical protein V501_06451 [Pseudogymnoascus sp. VKM F-4519 (FW-2642)]|nr:hypothetical protein V501_06451 [Pseudogymnoascus sp. VKM F-4519 (FW-2642)]